MNMRTSHSQINTALLCPWAYYVSTRHRDKMTIKTQQMMQGIAAHEAIEDYLLNYEDKFAHRNAKKIESIVASAYRKLSNMFSEELTNVIKKYNEDYDNAIEEVKEAFLQRTGRPTRAPTMCREWFDHKDYFEGIEETEFARFYEEFSWCRFRERSSFLALYKHVVDCCTNFVSIGNKLKIYEELQVEVKINPRIQLFSRVKGGRIDLVCFNHTDKTATVLDVKTGYKEWSKTDILNEPQLLWYAVAVETMFPDYSVNKIGIADSRNKQLVEVGVTDKDLQRFHALIEGSVYYETEMDLSIENEGIEAACKRFPVPIGRYGFACPCTLIHETNNEIKCPLYVEHNETEDTTNG